MLLDEDPLAKSVRAERFKDHLSTPTHSSSSSSSGSSSSVFTFASSGTTHTTIRGTCQALEKDYYRLTANPPASSIRPEHILRQSLEMVKNNFLETDDYSYANNQLKSIRQDITVQNICNRFAAHVYETHARIALEQGDLCEYNQCQSQIQLLAKQGVRVSQDEFDCYRLLYALHTDAKLELSSVCSKDNLLSCRGMATQYALQVVGAVRSCNTKRFFELYASPPHQSIYLLHFLLSQQRKLALQQMIRSYHSFPIHSFQQRTIFETSHACLKFLKEQGVEVDATHMTIECLQTTKKRAAEYVEEEAQRKEKAQQEEEEEGQVKKKLKKKEKEREKEVKTKKKKWEREEKSSDTKKKKKFDKASSSTRSVFKF